MQALGWEQAGQCLAGAGGPRPHRADARTRSEPLQGREVMSVTLIGGMDRLRPEYVATAEALGHSLKCISRNERNFLAKIGSPDALIVFTNKISHEARRKAQQVARSRRIPILFVHSCGVSTLRECLPAAGCA